MYWDKSKEDGVGKGQQNKNKIQRVVTELL